MTRLDQSADSLENRIGYTFRDTALRELALAHSSFVNENKLRPEESNERLEFLGDAVLELIVSEKIYADYPNLDEGSLSKLRASVVCEPMLAKRARLMNLGGALKMGKGEEKTGRERDSILSDAFEAVLGAIYLDGGYQKAKKYVLDNLTEEIQSMRTRFEFADPKTYLQEQIQKNSQVALEYAVLSETGPDHEKEFTVQVSHEGKALGTGSGRSKKEAEQNAAYQAIQDNRF